MFTLRAGSTVHVVAESPGLLALTVTLVEQARGRAWVHSRLEDCLGHIGERRGEPAAGGCCIVIDVAPGGAAGLRPLWLTRSLHPVVVIAAPGDVETAVQVMKDGAFDCIEPPVNPVELLDAVIAAVERDFANRLRNGREAELRSRAESLTPRERQIMAMLAEGTLNKVIASRLGLSRRTVETHRTNVMHKMNASSVVQLINMSMSLAESDLAQPLHCGPSNVATAAAARVAARVRARPPSSIGAQVTGR